ncbi:hypothetical protein F5Y05DRAFT_423534 [Hypoxylon sp. FL0543]|nr:hypothetical protein F5Y05DRAFT_423534 [Hypoxylon sp. FL0543]
MVAFHRLFLLGAALLNAANAVPTPGPKDLAAANGNVLPEGETIHGDFASDEADESTEVVKRVARRTTIQWSPQGRLVFWLGAKVPQALMDSFTETLGPGALGKVLLENFHEWLNAHAIEQYVGWVNLGQCKVQGGIYGKAAEVLHDFGFAIVAPDDMKAQHFQAIIGSIRDWVAQSGGIVQIIPRPNNFFDPVTIGASLSRYPSSSSSGSSASSPDKRDVEARSRGNTCPANTNLIKYATATVNTNININADVRFAGACVKK